MVSEQYSVSFSKSVSEMITGMLDTTKLQGMWSNYV